MNTKSWISYNYHVSWNIILLIFFNHSKVQKPNLAHGLYKSRWMAGQIGPRAVLCQPLVQSKKKDKFIYKIQSYFFFRVKYHSEINKGKENTSFIEYSPDTLRIVNERKYLRSKQMREERLRADLCGASSAGGPKGVLVL